MAGFLLSKALLPMRCVRLAVECDSQRRSCRIVCTNKRFATKNSTFIALCMGHIVPALKRVNVEQKYVETH